MGGCLLEHLELELTDWLNPLLCSRCAWPFVCFGALACLLQYALETAVPGGASVAVAQSPHSDSSGVAGEFPGPAIPGDYGEACCLAPVPIQGAVWETVEP